MICCNEYFFLVIPLISHTLKRQAIMSIGNKFASNLRTSNKRVRQRSLTFSYLNFSKLITLTNILEEKKYIWNSTPIIRNIKPKIIVADVNSIDMKCLMTIIFLVVL